MWKNIIERIKLKGAHTTGMTHLKTVEPDRQYEINLHVFSHISFYLTVNTFRHHYKDQTVAQIIAVYFEIHTKHTSKRSGHIEEIQDVKIGVTR